MAQMITEEEVRHVARLSRLRLTESAGDGFWRKSISLSGLERVLL